MPRAGSRPRTSPHRSTFHTSRDRRWTATPSPLRRLDRIYTGQPSSLTIERGTCAEIATGAPMPAGADAVVMVEETSSSHEGDMIDVFAAATAGQHIGRRGADISEGDRVIAAGDVLSPA